MLFDNIFSSLSLLHINMGGSLLLLSLLLIWEGIRQSDQTTDGGRTRSWPSTRYFLFSPSLLCFSYFHFQYFLSLLSFTFIIAFTFTIVLNFYFHCGKLQSENDMVGKLFLLLLFSEKYLFYTQDCSCLFISL